MDEIAHIGAYPRAQHRALLEWYRVDENGPYVRFPKRIKNTGVRTELRSSSEPR